MNTFKKFLFLLLMGCSFNSWAFNVQLINSSAYEARLDEAPGAVGVKSDIFGQTDKLGVASNPESVYFRPNKTKWFDAEIKIKRQASDSYETIAIIRLTEESGTNKGSIEFNRPQNNVTDYHVDAQCPGDRMLCTLTVVSGPPPSS